MLPMISDCTNDIQVVVLFVGPVGLGGFGIGNWVRVSCQILSVDMETFFLLFFSTMTFPGASDFLLEDIFSVQHLWLLFWPVQSDSQQQLLVWLWVYCCHLLWLRACLQPHWLQQLGGRFDRHMDTLMEDISKTPDAESKEYACCLFIMVACFTSKLSLPLGNSVSDPLIAQSIFALQSGI